MIVRLLCDVTLCEILVHLVHRIYIIAHLLVKTRLFRNGLGLIVCPQSTHIFILPVFPFVSRFKTLLQDANFYIGFEIVIAAMDVFCEFIIIRSGFAIVTMLRKSGTQILSSLSDI